MADVFLVLGMHRGGTSSVAGVLSLLGAVPPKTLMPATADNERGYWESMRLQQFHDELLRSAGSVWDDWRAFNPAWYKAPGFDMFKQQAKDLFKEEFNGSALACLKDPRICRFAPFWLKVLDEMSAYPRIVIPVRSPLEVARSLKRRDRFPLTKGLLLWLRHVLDGEAATRSLPRAIFTWNDFLSDWRLVVDVVATRIDISWPRLSDRSAREIDEFLNGDLKHNGIQDKELARHPDVHEWTRQTYEAMVTLARQPDSNKAYNILDNVRSMFESSCNFFGRVTLDYESEFEQIQGTQAALQVDRDHWQAQHQQIATALAETRAEKDAAANQLTHRIAEADSALSAAQVDRDHWQAQYDEVAIVLSQTRAEQDAAASEFARRIAEADSALSAVQVDRDHWHAEYQQLVTAVEARLATVEESLARTREDKLAAESEAARLSSMLAEEVTVASDLREKLADATAQQEAEVQRHMALERRSNEAAARIADLEAKTADLKQEVERREREIGAILRSTSWKLSAPWRTFKRRISRLSRLLRGKRASPLFDRQWYLEQYSDVRNSEIDPYQHYLLHGAAEGRLPHPTERPPST